LSDNIIIFFFIAYTIPLLYLSLSNSVFFLAFLAQNIHMCQIIITFRSLLLTFLLCDDHFLYEHLAVFYQLLFTPKSIISVKFKRSIRQENDCSKKTR